MRHYLPILFNPINDTLEHIRRTYIPLLGGLVSAYNESRGTKYYVEGATAELRQMIFNVSTTEQ